MTSVHRAGNMIGLWVEYHGTHRAWHGHPFLVTARLATARGPRYELADMYGRHIFTNVSPGSITPIRSALTSTWEQRLKTIATATQRHGESFTAQIRPHLETVCALLQAHQYVEAQHLLLDLEIVVGLIDVATHHQCAAELRRAHGRPPHRPA